MHVASISRLEKNDGRNASFSKNVSAIMKIVHEITRNALALHLARMIANVLLSAVKWSAR